MWSGVALALALFAGTAAAAGTPFGHQADVAITTWLQGAGPGAEEPASLLVYLGNAGTIIPALAAIGVVLLLFDWKVAGRGAIWLAVGAACVSAVSVLCKNVIPSSGPPDSLKSFFLRPPDTPMQALHSLGVSNAFIVGFAAATLILLVLAEPRRDRAVLALGLLGASLALAFVLRSLVTTDSFAHILVRPHHAPYGFPSGHVARITLFSWVVLRRMPWLAAALVLCMMLSLTYLGDHWPLQNLGGLWLGCAAIVVGASLWRWLGEGSPEMGLGREEFR